MSNPFRLGDIEVMEARENPTAPVLSLGYLSWTAPAGGGEVRIAASITNPTTDVVVAVTDIANSKTDYYTYAAADITSGFLFTGSDAADVYENQTDIDDWVDAGGGDDVIYSGTGVCNILAGPGADTVWSYAEGGGLIDVSGDPGDPMTDADEVHITAYGKYTDVQADKGVDVVTLPQNYLGTVKWISP